LRKLKPDEARVTPFPSRRVGRRVVPTRSADADGLPSGLYDVDRVRGIAVDDGLMPKVVLRVLRA
jgi:hypothetical protein